MKTTFKLFLLVAILVYLAFAFLDFSRQGDHTVCKEVRVTIADSSHAGFITPDEALRILRNAGQYPVGRRMSRIEGNAIEKALKRNSFIESASCYKAPNGVVNVLIEQRLPLMRVISDNGDDYYIDGRGNTMNPRGYVADIVVATGHISRQYARRHLLPLGQFLHDNPFWDDQIEQIHVSEKRQVELSTRVGGQLVKLGTPDSLARKFRNLYAFYEKVMPQVGWNKYTAISVEHTTQIVCEKAHKKD